MRTYCSSACTQIWTTTKQSNGTIFEQMYENFMAKVSKLKKFKTRKCTIFWCAFPFQNRVFFQWICISIKWHSLSRYLLPARINRSQFHIEHQIDEQHKVADEVRDLFSKKTMMGFKLANKWTDDQTNCEKTTRNAIEDQQENALKGQEMQLHSSWLQFVAKRKH